MGRFSNSWQIVKASARVMRQDKELLVLPVLSFLASVVLAALVAGVTWQGGLWPVHNSATGAWTFQPGTVILAFLVYFGLAFINVFFAAAVVVGASERLAGGNPTLASSIRGASRRMGRLLAWAAITATVSLVLSALRERGGTAGKIFAALGSMAWSLATYFVVPVLVLEETKVKDSIGRAGSLFKKTWGETVIGTGGVGAVFGAAFFVVALLGMVILQGSIQTPAALVVLAVLVGVLVLLAILQSVLGGVYKAALYRYAATGEVSAGFVPTQVQGAFIPQ